MQQVLQKSSVSAWHAKQSSDYDRIGFAFPSYNTYNKYYLAWRSRVVTPASGKRCCPVCLFKPKIISVDGVFMCSRRFPDSFAGTVLTVDADMYHGTPVTHCEGPAVETKTRRLDRCFIEGKGQSANRGFLRVIAGVRRVKGDSQALDFDDFESGVNACEASTRYKR